MKIDYCILTKGTIPFFIAKDVGKGTGPGMNIAYNIIKKHNDTINVESEVGKGTTFVIRLKIDYCILTKGTIPIFYKTVERSDFHKYSIFNLQ